jgi:hypothetical protein
MAGEALQHRRTAEDQHVPLTGVILYNRIAHEDDARHDRTLWRRRDDILAFFEHHASNGPTEAINGRLEALRRNGLGFRNLTHYRIRSLLHSGALHGLVNAL